MIDNGGGDCEGAIGGGIDCEGGDCEDAIGGGIAVGPPAPPRAPAPQGAVEKTAAAGAGVTHSLSFFFFFFADAVSSRILPPFGAVEKVAAAGAGVSHSVSFCFFFLASRFLFLEKAEVFGSACSFAAEGIFESFAVDTFALGGVTSTLFDETAETFTLGWILDNIVFSYAVAFMAPVPGATVKL